MARATTELTAWVARQILWADFDAGNLYWKPRTCKSWNAKYAGQRAFTGRDKDGYHVGWALQKMHKAHRVIWLLKHGEWHEDQIDHINGDRADNRLVNLRVVSNQENMRNKKMYLTNTSGVTGVFWYKRYEKWCAQIRVNGQAKNLGYYADIDDAIAVRAAAEIKYGFHKNHGRI